MNNTDEILKRVLLNMRYDSKMTLKENVSLVTNLLNEQVTSTTKVGDYTVSFDSEYKRIKIDSPSGREYYWRPSGGWYRITYNLGNETFTDLDPTKESKTITTLRYVLKKSGIGSLYYIKNTEQGNNFRSWVNKKDPSFAKSINLSLEGPYDNDYIRKAWSKYGDEYKEELKTNKPLGSNDADTQRTIQDLKSKGFDASGAVSMNQAFALAALRGTKKLTDKISSNMGGSTFQVHSICVKKVGSTCAPGTYLTVDSFNLDMANKINSLTDKSLNLVVNDKGTLQNAESSSKGWKPPQYTFLQNFYFDWGKIMEDLTNTFKYDKNAYKSDLFPDGWWGWFTTYWGSDILNNIKTHPDPQNVKVTDKNEYDKKYTMWSTEFIHDASSFIEIGTLILGLIPSPLSPLLLGISTGAGLVDAGTYFAEGDKYMGSMMLALEIIPGGEFLKVFKGSKTATKLGKEGTLELLEGGAKKTLSGSEEIAFQDLKQELKVIAPEVASATQKQIVKNVKTGLLKTFKTLGGGLVNFFKIVKLVWKITGKIPEMVIKVGGTAWTIDKLYLAFYGRDEDRQNSDIRKLYYLLKDGQLPDDLDMEKNIALLQQMIPETIDKKMWESGLNIGKEDDELLLQSIRNFNEKNFKSGNYNSSQSDQTYVKSPTIESVKNGDKFITYGMFGPEITEIKNIIKTKWYGDVNDEKLQKTISNDKFDDDLYQIITDFQLNIIPKYFESEIKSTELGEIGKETLDYLNRSSINKMKIKKIDSYSLEKDKWDFYFLNKRTNKWVPVSYEDYLIYKDDSFKVTATPKSNNETIKR